MVDLKGFRHSITLFFLLRAPDRHQSTIILIAPCSTPSSGGDTIVPSILSRGGVGTTSTANKKHSTPYYRSTSRWRWYHRSLSTSCTTTCFSPTTFFSWHPQYPAESKTYENPAPMFSAFQAHFHPKQAKSQKKAAATRKNTLESHVWQLSLATHTRRLLLLLRQH